MRWSRPLAAAALAIAACAAAPARAAETPIARRTALGVDVRWWSAQDSGSVFPIVPFVHVEVVPDVFVDLDAAGAPQTDDGGRFGIGNPMIGAHWAATPGGGAVTWFAGLRVGVPLATLGDPASDLADDYASAASAHYDVYRWVPEMLPLVATVGLEAHPTRALWIRVPLTPMVFVPTTSRRDGKGGFEARFEIEGVSPMGLGGGYALQVIGSNAFRTREEERVQIASEPYLVFDDDSFFFRLGLLLALNRPLGFGLEEGGVLAPHLEIGGHL